MNQQIKVGIIGCGTAAEKLHLPMLQKIREVKVSILVDKDYKRAKELQRQYNAEKVADDYRHVLGEVEVALITLPNYLHSRISVEFLNKGTHVFCEKPMAVNLKEAKEMIKASEKNKKKLGIGMVRRYFEINQKIKQLIDSNYLGKVKYFEYEEGFPFNWPTKSTYVFSRNQAGGGVLIDMGSHVVDMVDWLFGSPTKIQYRDDGHGGVEANCQIELVIKGVKGRIELSRDRNLKNVFRVTCQNGYLEVPAGELTNLSLKKGGPQEIITSKETFEGCILKELLDFMKAIRNERSSYISGEEAAKSVKIIDYCYAHKKHIYEPWL